MLESLAWRCLYQLCRLAFLLVLCRCMLRLNLHLAQSNLEAAGALEAIKLAKAALNEFAESVAASADVVRATSERRRLTEPSLFAPLGGFSHVTIDALSLITNLWPVAGPSLQQMLL